MNRLLTSSTTVLMPPMIQFSFSLPFSNASRILVAVDAQAEEQRAEEHHLGGQEHPHAQRGRLVLLFEVGDTAPRAGGAPGPSAPARRAPRASGWRVSEFILCFLHVVLVGAADHDGRLGEVIRGRRRGRLPFQAGRLPGIRPGRLAVARANSSR